MGNVARFSVDSDDVHFVAVRARAEGADAAFRWATRAGHRVIERVGPHGTQLVVPPGGGLRQLLIEDAHKAGHFGVKRTCDLLSTRVFWPQLHKDVALFVGTWEICQK